MAAQGATSRVLVAGIPISHPDRVIYPDGGLTKVDIARYYDAVAERMLPHVAGRPLTLLRCAGPIDAAADKGGCTMMPSEHDRIVVDLDPGPDVPWKEVVAAAKLARRFLADLGLQSWVKTTGGKGLHVVVPIEPTSIDLGQGASQRAAEL